MDERERIVLGALFHDIGKVVQRASDNPRQMTHQEFGAEWIKSKFKNTPYEELSDFALYHHFTKDTHPELDARSTYRNDILLAAYADTLSAEEREEHEGKFDPSRPLKSIFSSVQNAKAPVFYRPEPLSSGIFYPQRHVNLTKEDYQKLLEGLENAIEGKLIAPDTLLGVFEEFFTLIPSHTAEVDGFSTDVSLFDYLKTTAAIALANYNFLVEKHRGVKFSQIQSDEILNSRENRYMFVGVDISGIQDFIYTISSKGALKLLRARSFYIEMLLEFVAMKLLKELSLFRTNLIFLGGGNFVILAQNTEDARKLVDLIIHDFNERLFDEHKGRLWLTHAVMEFNGEAFGDISRILDELGEGLQEAKSNKFATFEDLNKIFEPEETEGLYECEVCGAEIKKVDWEKDRKCPVCRNLHDVGGVIHRAKYIVYRPKDISDPQGILKVYRGEDLYLFDEARDGEIVWVINPSQDEFIEYGVNLYLGNYPKMGRNFDPEEDTDEAPSFRYFGTKLIGTLRMDVDNLGWIFSKGLSGKNRSISRLATLSRFFNLFFKRYINDIAAGNPGGLEQFSVVHPGESYPREVVVVYAGGDDLFIVGAWHDVAELAFDIRQAFRKFVGGDHITLSGGLALNHLKHPIHLFARDAGRAEEASKNRKVEVNGAEEVVKDAFTAFGRTLGWERWKEIIEKRERKGLLYIRENFFGSANAQLDRHRNTKFDPPYLNALKGENGLPRTFIYRMMKISDELLENGFRLKPFVMLTYFLAKNPKLRSYFGEWLKINRDSLEFLKDLKPVFVWLDILKRG